MSTETIVLGGGCFWCTEAVFKMLRGVKSTMPGYAGGTKANPTYEEVCDGNTGHAEVLKVEYDPKAIPLETLLTVFFEMHDPTSLNRQGADTGTQYRSIILYTDKSQLPAIEKSMKEAQKDRDGKIVTEVKKLDAFYDAEDYHRDYFAHNRLQPYCMLVISPKVKKIKQEFANLTK